MACSTIRPTIIQAQRILKIVESLYQKMIITKYLNFEFLAHFVDEETRDNSGLDQDLLQCLKPKTLQYLGKISRYQQDIFNLKNQDYVEAPDEDLMEDEEEMDSNLPLMDDEQDDQKEETETENEEEKRAREERKTQVLELKEEMSSVYRNFVRHLTKNKGDVEIIKVK